ncbi:MFS general substrate transporter [Lichtheimia hyalospora FSU 10163]|nr:MFS general substrate transporter [Lichtheimia hyalospora FSU 10163]
MQSSDVKNRSPSLANDHVIEEKIEYSNKTPFMAWIVLVSIMLVNAACNIMWTTCSSAPTPSAEWMQIDFDQLNWLSNACAIVNTLLSLPAGWAYERFGIKACISFSGIINLIGAWIRYAAVAAPPEKRYTIVMVGQVIGGIGGPFAYNLSPLGLHHKIELSATRLSFKVVGIICTCCAVPILLTPKLPKVPPSASAAAPRTSIWKGVKMLCRNFQYISTVIVAGVNCGMFYAISVIIIQAAVPYGYTDQQGGIAMAVITIAGYAGGAFVIVENGFGPLICICFLIGFFSMGVFPVQLEYACEVSYPVPEAIASNVIWTLDTVVMLIFTVIANALRGGPEADPPGNMRNALIAAVCIMAFFSLPILWLKSDLKRLAVDRRRPSLIASV